MSRSRVQTFRSTTKGARPGTDDAPLAAEAYVNYPDMQLGFRNADSTANVDMLPVRFFSTGADYVVGDHVVQAGNLYKANGAITAGAFNGAQWTAVAGSGGSGTTISISDAFPSSPVDGQLFWQSSTGCLYLRFNDTTSTQWVQINATLPDAGADSKVYARQNNAWVDTGRRRLSTTTLTGAAVTIALPAGYDKFELECCEMGATANINPAIQVSLDGTTFITTASYFYSLSGMSATNTWVTGQTSGTFWNTFVSTADFATAGVRHSFTMHFYPGGTGLTSNGRIEASAWSGGVVKHALQGLYFANTGRVQALKLIASSGAFNAGKVHLFGIPS